MSELRSVAGLVDDMVGVRPSQSLIHRWTTVGCRGVRLEAAVIGGEFQTTSVAFDEFVSKARFSAAVDLMRDPGDPVTVAPIPVVPRIPWLSRLAGPGMQFGF